MKLVVGLGNPGKKYEDTRHNIGFMVADSLIGIYDGFWGKDAKFESELFANEEIVVSKPQTFMNNTGTAVRKLSVFYKILASDIYVIHDDLDISLGEWKIEKGHGPQLHNGVNSIEQELGKVDFWRVRIGIDNRDSDDRLPGEAYVLQSFTDTEKLVVSKIIPQIITELNLHLQH